MSAFRSATTSSVTSPSASYCRDTSAPPDARDVYKRQKMRRGALVDLCLEVGANKLALGHHRDDAIETLFLSMLYEGRIHTFHPVTHLTRKGITQIRPLVYLPEKHVLHLSLIHIS